MVNNALNKSKTPYNLMLALSRALTRSLPKLSLQASIRASFGGGHHAEPIVPFDDSGAVVRDSLQSTIKGFANLNNIEEHNPLLTDEEKKTMKRFLIYRSNPSVNPFL